jgi:hypothetical protein
VAIGGFVALAALPVVRMVLLVRSGTDTQFLDYWYVLDRVLTDGGGIDLRGLFTIHDIHPLVVPAILYWLNARVGSGTNSALGLVVVVLALVEVGLLGWFAWRTLGHGVRRWGLFLVATSFLMFTPAGAWNFLEAMSGAAWLPANVFVLLAIWCAVRRWTWPMLAFGALASISYGTGLLVWPVTAVVLALRDGGLSRAGLRRGFRSAVPSLVGGAIAALLYVAAPVGQGFVEQSAQADLGWATPRAFLAVTGFIFAGDVGAASLLGVLGIISGVLLSRQVIARGGFDLVWVGVWIYGMASIALMALGRSLPASAPARRSGASPSSTARAASSARGSRTAGPSVRSAPRGTGDTDS